MLRCRLAARSLVDVVLYVTRTGRWWIPLAVILLSVTAVVVGVAKVVVPTVVYTLF